MLADEGLDVLPYVVLGLLSCAVKTGLGLS